MSTSVNSVQPETQVNDNACIYNIHPPNLLYFSGIPVISIEFVGYLLLAQPSPALYPLYCLPAGLDHLKLELSLFTYLRAPMIHSMAYESPSIEVPVFILALPEIMPFLNLPWICGRSTSDDSDMIYGVYDCAGVAHAHEPETIIHFAEYPYGHYLPLPQDDNQSVDGSSILQTTWIGSIAICCGHSNNPHALVNVNYADHRCELLNSCWPKSLMRANVIPENLETVLTKDTKVPMLENAVVALALPWITQFLYDNRRVVTHSMDDSCIFGLGNFFGLAQRYCIVTLLQMFTRPYAHLLPFCANAFVKFLRHQMVKELIYHIVFRTTATCRVRLTIADLEPTTFRNATNPPVDTLALMGSCCYQALLARLILIWGTIDPMPDYPTPSQVHAELCETAMMLIQQVEDPQFINFMGQLRELCTITEADVCRIALISWLQEQGRDILPASLYITASVLFGWVNTHDLIALLDATRDKCNVWLNTSSHFQDVMGPDSHANRTLFGSPQILDNDPYLCESFQGLDDQFLCLPRLLKTWVDNLTYRAYMSASFAESRSLCINTSDNFEPMESKTMDILRSDIHILGLKKQCAQAEVDMFSKALARIAKFEGTDHDTSPRSAVMHASLPSDDYYFDDFFSTSYASSYGSVIL
ncbi:hypothetical protein DFH29DRAFT_1003821 [Suillus ampliporus]|nr:hypothetical protein DFH29DRAFT_1003821 [Suillus ampliporus]